MTPLQLVAYTAYVDACVTIGWVPLPQAEWLNTPASAEYVDYSFKCVSVKEEPLPFPEWSVERQEYEAYRYRCQDQKVPGGTFKDWLLAKQMREGDLRAEYREYCSQTHAQLSYEEWLVAFKGELPSTPKSIAAAANAGPMLFDRSLIDSVPVTVTTTGNSAWVNKLECLARLTFNRGARKGGAYVAEVFPKDNGDLRNPPKHCVTQELEFAVRFVVEELAGIHDLKLTEAQINTLRSVDPDAAGFATASEDEGSTLSVTDKAAKWDKLAQAIKMQRVVVYGQLPVTGEFDEAVNAELRARCMADIHSLECLLESLGF